jgi:hypothetical protein
MTTTHSTAARNAATDAVTALIGASGNLKFRLSGTVSAPGAAVATLPLSADAFGDASGGTATPLPATRTQLAMRAQWLPQPWKHLGARW